MTTKPKYQKPVAIDMGSLKPVHGAVCGSGNFADEGCGVGNDPAVQPVCTTTGGIASGNCEQNGNTAAKTCFATGADPGWGCYMPG